MDPDLVCFAAFDDDASAVLLDGEEEKGGEEEAIEDGMVARTSSPKFPVGVDILPSRESPPERK